MRIYPYCTKRKKKAALDTIYAALAYAVLECITLTHASPKFKMNY